MLALQNRLRMPCVFCRGKEVSASTDALIARDGVAVSRRDVGLTIGGVGRAAIKIEGAVDAVVVAQSRACGAVDVVVVARRCGAVLILCEIDSDMTLSLPDLVDTLPMVTDLLPGALAHSPMAMGLLPVAEAAAHATLGRFAC